MNRLKSNELMISLLNKYIENQCNEQELHILLNWLKSSDDICDFDQASHLLWDKINQQIMSTDDRHITELNKEVNLLLTEFQGNKTNFQYVNTSRLNYKHYLTIASVALIAVISTILFFHHKMDITYQEIVTGRGETLEYTLVDGTHITLNSESKLFIPSDFNEENRTVEMHGEGFFKVAHNPQKPFLVKSGDTRIKVLGTVFNLKAYDEDVSIEVTVSEGKVLVNYENLDMQLRMTPNEHLSINKKIGTISKITINENNYNKWTDGSLYFEKEPLKEVIKIINRKYERKVILRCEDCNRLISGRHDNKSIEAVIDAICFTTGLKSKIEQDQIILYE